MKLGTPLHSFTAKGPIGDGTTLKASPSGTLAIKTPIPTDRRSEAQLDQRQLFKDARDSWRHVIISATSREDWRRINTYKLKKGAAFNSYISQAVKALEPGGDISFAYSSATIAGSKIQWVMKNIPSGDTGDEAGNFEIWVGPNPAKLHLKETKTIIAGSVISSTLDSDQGESYATLKKDLYYRAGIAALAPGAAPAADASPIGSTISFAGNTVPDGWLYCDGTAISRTTYPQLFVAIGTTYGAGDGSTTFNLPDLVGYFLRGGVADGTPVADSTAQATIPLAVDNDNANHDHGNSGNQSATHTHTGTSGNESAGHTHTLSTGINSGDHTHTATTGNQSADHTHTGTSGNQSASHNHVITVANHLHQIREFITIGGSSQNSAYAEAGNSDGAKSHKDTELKYLGPTAGNQSASHTHDTTTGNQSASHTHSSTSAIQSADHTHNATTDAISNSHTHTTTTGNNDVDHTHPVNAANATHNHSMSGGDAETAPVHMLMKFIIKAT